jgi:hypothetical protein
MASKKSKRGRKADPSSMSGKIRALLSTGMSPSEIAKKVGCKPGLVYNVRARVSGGGKRGRRGPGRPARGAGAQLDGLSGILDAVKNSERERMQLRSALEKLQAVIADALA